jgi:hypothetical protein
LGALARRVSGSTPPSGTVDHALAIVDELAAIGAPQGAGLPFTAGPLDVPPRTAAG